MVHLQAIASHLPDTPMMVYDTGRWAHFNVKLHFYKFGVIFFHASDTVFIEFVSMFVSLFLSVYPSITKLGAIHAIIIIDCSIIPLLKKKSPNSLYYIKCPSIHWPQQKRRKGTLQAIFFQKVMLNE